MKTESAACDQKAPRWNGDNDAAPTDAEDRLRRVDIAVLSDLHLGTTGCRADALLHYLTNLRPGMVILVGDVVDISRSRNNHWPETHMRIVRKLLKFVVHGVPVYYVTGNHDAGLRRYAGLELGGLHLVRSLDLDVKGKRLLVVHGDQFDPEHHLAGRLLRCIGGGAYSLLLCCNNIINRFRRWYDRAPVSLAPRILRFFGGIRRYIGGFVERAREHARQAGFDGIICGHIHQPALDDEGASCRYLNGGDWVQHCTALELVDGAWRLHQEPVTRPLALPDDVTMGDDHRLVTAA